MNKAINETYEQVQKKNRRYRYGNLLKSMLLTGITFTLLTFSPKESDAQARRIMPGMRRPVPIIWAYPRMSYYGVYGPWGSRQQFNVMQAGSMFCYSGLRREYIAVPRGAPRREIDVEAYEAEIERLEAENKRLRERKPQVVEKIKEMEKEVPVEVIKEVPAKYPEYHLGYEDRDILPGQWNSQATSYFNYYFNLEGNILHAYSPGRVYVDGKSYDFDIVVRREKDGALLCALEFYGNGDPTEKKKIELTESGEVKGYVIEPTAKSGSDFAAVLKPYKDIFLVSSVNY